MPLSVDRDAEELAREIAGLLPLDAAALRQKWAALFGADPSPYLGRLLLIRAIAHRLQEKAFPGLKPFAQRALVRVAESGAKVTLNDFLKRELSAGTVLIQE
jgi:Protein of unknown function (DUF2924)